MDNDQHKLMHVENLYRGENKENKKKKFCFNECKKNTIHSLNEVEYFLNNLDKTFKCFKFYKLFH